MVGEGKSPNPKHENEMQRIKAFLDLVHIRQNIVEVLNVFENL
jgi:hypothetical protein